MDRILVRVVIRNGCCDFCSIGFSLFCPYVWGFIDFPFEFTSIKVDSCMKMNKKDLRNVF